MRLFLAIVIAILVSAIAGALATVAGSALISCRSDAAGCGMGDAYRILFVPAEVIVVVIVLAISAIGRNRERALRMTMKVLILVPVFLVSFGIISDLSSGRATRADDVIEALQLAVPFWIVVLVQWVILRSVKRDEQTMEASLP